jgi:N-acetylmuramoyl-L-alanine amidase
MIRRIVKILIAFCLLLLVAKSVAEAQNRTRTAARVTRAQTRESERLLAELGYWTGPVDGVFDAGSRFALVAFQKWEQRPVTGTLSLAEIEAIRGAKTPTPRDGDYEHVEVDVDRQVLLIIDGKGGVRVLPVSTGTDKPFVYGGQESIAYTPRGRFIVYEKGVGWEDNSLGMYYPNYISGGIAVHGSLSVPAKPASHGCIRIPLYAAREVSKLLRLGTIVLVYDKVSFVSAKVWVENPKLKEAALANSVVY